MDFTRISEIEQALITNKYSPGNAYWEMLSLMADDNIVPSESTTPFSTLMAHIIVAATVNNQEVDYLGRMDSAEYAETYEELARFLPYTRLSTIYAKPMSAPFILSLRKSDLLNYGVTESVGVKRVIIPRNTTFTYQDGTVFGLMFDVDLRITDETVIDAVLLDNNNPLVPLVSPVLKVSEIPVRDENNTVVDQYISLALTAYQISREQSITNITKATGFTKTFTITDQYYHARVYTQRDGGWLELDTAFSDFIYNPQASTPVAVTKLDGSKLTITIPQVFFTRNLVGSSVKVELYTTKGNLSVDYTMATEDNWTVDFLNRVDSLSAYTTPLKSFKEVIAGSTTRKTGGSDIPDFSTLQQEVINGVVDNDPVTEAELVSQLSIAGYNTVHLSNYLTENVYLATRALDSYQTDTIPVSYPGGNVPLLFRPTTDYYGVNQNGSNYTFTTDALLRYNNGQTEVVTQSDGEALLGSTQQTLLSTFNDDRYLSPLFHYVMELGTVNEVYAYHLKAPVVLTRDFVGINANAEGTIGSKTATVVLDGSDYVVTVTTAATSTYRGYGDTDFIAQLVVTNDQNQKLAVNSTGVTRNSDGDYIFEFRLPTTFDIRNGLGIKLDTLRTEYGDTGFVNLDTTFDFAIVLTNNLPIGQDTQWQTRVLSALLPTNYQVVSMETMEISFGTAVDGLYRPVRTLAGETIFATYQEDVLAVYEEDVLEQDSNGFVKFYDNPDYDPDQPVTETNYPVLPNLLHRAGDPIMVNGQQEVKFAKGTIIRDPNTGAGIVAGRRAVSVETSMVCGDYRFRLAGVDVDAGAGAVVDRIVNDINAITLSKFTKLYYDVSRTVGTTGVTYGTSQTKALNKELTFTYDVMVDELTYKDAKLRQLIASKIRTVTANLVNGAVNFAVNKLIGEVNTAIGDSVAGFTISEIGGYTDVVNFTVPASSDTIGIAPMLAIDNSGQFAIEDGITINFNRNNA